MADKKSVFTDAIDGQYFVRLESEHDSSLTAAAIHSIGMIETLSSGSPILVLKFVDGLGDLITDTYISPDAEYNMYMGKSEETTAKTSFSISSMSASNMQPGRTDNVAMDLTFISSAWPSLIKQQHSRSWQGVSYSDVVSEIIQECGFVDYAIEETKGIVDVIQPYWSNLRMLKWIAKRAVSSASNAGFEYGVTTTGKFVFRSIDALISEKPKRSLTLTTTSVNEPLIFGSFAIKQDYSYILNQGGFGLNTYHFDYDTKTFENSQKKISDTTHAQLSDWLYMSTEHENASRTFYGGRDTDTPDVAECKMVDSVNSTQKIDITINGDISLHIGDIIDLLIPPAEFSTKIVNDRYSGSWMISKVVHDINMKRKVFNTHLTLIRSGINGINLKGLVKTQKGKKVS